VPLWRKDSGASKDPCPDCNVGGDPTRGCRSCRRGPWDPVTLQRLQAVAEANATTIATIGSLRLKSDPSRIVTPEGEYLLSANARAEVTASGDVALAATRGRNIARGLAWTVPLGPLGLWAGRAKVEHHQVDSRELHLVVEGDDWAFVQQLAPSMFAAAKDFAAKVNGAARNLSAPPSLNDGRASFVYQLRELADLHQTGALTDEEFASAKAKLVG
jgi:hypothetical protein